MSTDPDIRELRVRIQELEKDRDTVFKKLYGNGDLGLISRLQEAEGKISNLTKLAWVLSSVIAGLLVELVKGLLS